MPIFNLTCVPGSTLYKRILELGLQNCKSVLIIVRKGMELSEKAQTVIARMAQYLTDRRDVSEWPGTKLLDETAIAYRFAYNYQVLELLTEVADSFFDWEQPDLPEDLCLLRHDLQPWFVTIVHEGDCYFEVTGDEAREIEKEIPQLGRLVLQQ